MKQKIKLIITMLVLGACWAVVYLVPFLQYTWYDPFKEFIGGTNTQLGLLLTIYGFGNVFGAPIGGWMADRFNYKIIYVLSVFLNGVFAILFLVHPTYGFAVVMWIGFAIASLFFNYPAHIKIVRELASDENQGKIFGFNETSIGLFNVIISSAMMFAFTKFATNVGGIRAAVICNAIISFALTILAIIVLENPAKKKAENAPEAIKYEIPVASEEAVLKDNKEKKNFFADFKEIAKQPATWLVAVSIFAVYSFMTTLTYFTPYFTQVMGITVTFTGWAAIARQYGMQIVGAPIGGVITDRLKSPSKVLIVVYIIGLAGLIYMLVPKASITVPTVIIITLALSFFVYIGRGAYYATLTEAGVPRELSASTIGIAAAVGFSPDLFQFTLFGYWLDTQGNKAFNYIFIYQIIVLGIGILAALAIIKMSKKNKELESKVQLETK